MKMEYDTKEYRATSGFLLLWILLTLTIFISIGVGRWLHIPAYIGVGWIIFLFILPFVFEKRIKNTFTNRVLIEFDDTSFSINNYAVNTDISTHTRFFWKDIKSYKVYFSPAKNTIITIYLKNNTSKTWGFKDNKSSNEAINKDSLFTVFYSHIKQYNVDKSDNEKIILSHGFFDSKLGNAILWAEIVLIILGFSIHLFLHPQSSFLTLLLGFSLVIQQFLKRKQERIIYDKINQLD